MHLILIDIVYSFVFIPLNELVNLHFNVNYYLSTPINYHPISSIHFGFKESNPFLIKERNCQN